MKALLLALLLTGCGDLGVDWLVRDWDLRASSVDGRHCAATLQTYQITIGIYAAVFPQSCTDVPNIRREALLIKGDHLDWLHNEEVQRFDHIKLDGCCVLTAKNEAWHLSFTARGGGPARLHDK